MGFRKTANHPLAVGVTFLVAAGEFIKVGYGSLTSMISPTGFTVPFSGQAIVDVGVGILGVFFAGAGLLNMVDAFKKVKKDKDED